MRRRAVWIVSLLLAVACDRQDAKSEPVAAAVAPAPPAPTAAPVVAERICAGDDDCSANQLCLHSRCVDIAPDLPECNEFRVHFEFDSADLQKQEQPILQRAGRCLIAGAVTRAIVEGNADERGTAKYNLALGEHRAGVVRSYLRNLGVPAGRLRTVSHGKEKPLCGEHTEECWTQNRNAAVQVAR